MNPPGLGTTTPPCLAENKPTIAMQRSRDEIDANHPVRAVTGIARHLALPGEYSAIRLPSFPALERTAVMSFSQPTTLTCLPGPTETKVVLCRQAYYPLWCNKAATGTYFLSYNSDQLATGSEFDVNYNFGEGFFVGRSGNVAVLAGRTYPSVTNSAVYAELAYPITAVDASLGMKPFIYVPKNCTTYVVASGSAPATAIITWNATIEIWLGPGSISTFNTGATIPIGNWAGYSNPGSVGPSDGYWLRMGSVAATSTVSTPFPDILCASILVSTGPGTFGALTTCGGLFTASLVAKYDFIPAIVSSEFATTPLPWQSARVTAVGALMTNVTPIVSKAGTVLCGRTNPAANHMFTVTSAVVASLHPKEKAWLPMETGAYTYAPPSTDLSDFSDYVVSNGFTTALPVFRLENSAMQNCLYFTPGSTAESLAITCSWSLEFRSSSALFPLEFSRVSLETLHRAQLSLATAGYFFKNEEHRTVLDHVIEAVKLIHPAAGQAAQTARNVWKAWKGQQPRHKTNSDSTPARPGTIPAWKGNQMQPTSSTGSGWGGRGRGTKANKNAKPQEKKGKGKGKGAQKPRK